MVWANSINGNRKNMIELGGDNSRHCSQNASILSIGDQERRFLSFIPLCLTVMNIQLWVVLLRLVLVTASVHIDHYVRSQIPGKELESCIGYTVVLLLGHASCSNLDHSIHVRCLELL